MRVPAAAHEVAIVGGGAVGMLLACLLAQRGIDAVVLERRRTPAGIPRAIGIHPPGLAALDAAGVGGAVRAEAAVIREGVVVCRGRRLGGLAIAGEPILSLPQHRTEALLQARLGELAPNGLRRGVELVGLRVHGWGVELDVVSGAGSRSTVAAAYAVAADGVRSTVRRLLGLGWGRRRGAGRYAMADTVDGTGLPETAVLHFEPAGVVESFPLPAGARRWVARLDGSPGVLDASAFAALVADRTAAAVDRAPMSAPSIFTAGQHLASAFARGRIALVGDAAHEISPIGGQGMNLGWLDALRLDRVLAEALAAGAAPAPFEDYGRDRRAAAVRAVRRAEFNMAMGAPVEGLRLHGRNALVRALATPPIRKRLAAAFRMRGL